LKTKILGDFQTPIHLATQIVKALIRDGITWGRALEPTCGEGNFIQALTEVGNPNSEIIGIELQKEYAEEATKKFGNCLNVQILNNNIFNIDLGKDLAWKSDQPLLVIGNPPWVNNSTMGLLGGDNLPQKSNFKGLRGIEAITGNANFDIAEFIWLKLIADLGQRPATIALLCKTSVARNVLQYGYKASLPISGASIRRIDTKLWFDASVDACLFTISLSSGASSYQASIYDSLDAQEPDTTIGYVGESFVSNVALYEKFSFLDLQAKSDKRFIWRAGVKHDASSVMELRQEGSAWVNGFDEIVDVEDEYLFPFLKSSDVKRFDGNSVDKAVIVTQRKVGENTSHLEIQAPKLWNYLNKYKDVFAARKSSIYKNKPLFSIFGVGDYTFAPYKVIISGFYKNPVFIPVGNIGEKVILCDDTCYLLPFTSGIEAVMAAVALNHPVAQSFLKGITFDDAKRPFTKNLLSRIDIASLIAYLPEKELRERAKHLMETFFSNQVSLRLPTNFNEQRDLFKADKEVSESIQLLMF
jgi:hypothetical protein